MAFCHRTQNRRDKGEETDSRLLYSYVFLGIDFWLDLQNIITSSGLYVRRKWEAQISVIIEGVASEKCQNDKRHKNIFTDWNYWMVLSQPKDWPRWFHNKEQESVTKGGRLLINQLCRPTHNSWEVVFVVYFTPYKLLSGCLEVLTNIIIEWLAKSQKRCSYRSSSSSVQVIMFVACMQLPLLI